MVRNVKLNLLCCRESFFKTLNTLGVLQALEITLAADNRQTKSASVDILLFIVDFSPSMVREYMLQQLNNTDDVSDKAIINEIFVNNILGQNCHLWLK